MKKTVCCLIVSLMAGLIIGCAAAERQPTPSPSTAAADSGGFAQEILQKLAALGCHPDADGTINWSDGGETLHARLEFAPNPFHSLALYQSNAPGEQQLSPAQERLCCLVLKAAGAGSEASARSYLEQLRSPFNPFELSAGILSLPEGFEHCFLYETRRMDEVILRITRSHSFTFFEPPLLGSEPAVWEKPLSERSAKALNCSSPAERDRLEKGRDYAFEGIVAQTFWSQDLDGRPLQFLTLVNDEGFALNLQSKFYENLLLFVRGQQGVFYFQDTGEKGLGRLQLGWVKNPHVGTTSVPEIKTE